jgi:pyruvate dehydrogenase E2 component (dihydrolipoamide acetyltransferase)
MARSKREVPHYYLSTTIDLADALAWLESVNRDRPITERILPAALLLRASVMAVADQPRVNGWWIDDELQQRDQVDLGVGVALRGGGLIAPVIPAADQLDLDGTMDALRGIVGRARSGRLKGTDLGEATLTVTNLGDQGVESVYGVIAPPQVAVVGFGAVGERPWAIGGMLTVRPLVVATLSADHRATDGHEGARYLAVLDHLLHEPEAL